jgi:thymidylate synthase (FAD)
METKLITFTPDAEAMIARIARVSSDNQDNPEFAKLLTYLVKHQHWSPFEHAYATWEITTSLAVAPQILRHRSFTFQQLSRRYSGQDALPEFHTPRRQDLKNRQNSVDDLSKEDIEWFEWRRGKLFDESVAVYEEALGRGIAKECARDVLLESTQTRLYMTGSLRSWIHYINLRSANGTQKEHMDIAKSIGAQFKEQWPIIGKVALDI